jgi:putative serine protease PepD
VTPGGPPPAGEGPEDPEERRHKDEDHAGHEPGNPSASGWPPPQERSWRHPSELFSNARGGDRGAGSGRQGTGGTGGGRAGPGRSKRDRWVPGRRGHGSATVLIGTGIAAAIIAGGLLLATSVASNPSPAVQTTSATLPGALAVSTRHAVATLGRSLVLLFLTTPSGTTERCAIAVAPNGLVATTAESMDQVTSVSAETVGGDRFTATLVAWDSTSDVAVVRLPWRVPVPHFQDDDGLRSGQLATSVSLGGSSLRHLDPVWSVDTVRAVATPLLTSKSTGLGGITTEGVATRWPWGDVLVGAQGRVIGLEDEAATAQMRATHDRTHERQAEAARSGHSGQAGAGRTRSAGGTGTGDSAAGGAEASPEAFIPSALLLGVADQLAINGHVEHGWLGLHGRTHQAHSPAGALVESVDPGGPSAGRLQPGDVIVAVDGEAVRSMAELRARLYVMSPGATSRLTVVRNGVERQADVVLASSP